MLPSVLLALALGDGDTGVCTGMYEEGTVPEIYINVEKSYVYTS